MTIEEKIIEYLTDKGYAVYAERPPNPPEQYLIIDRISGEIRNYLYRAQVAIQSNAPTLAEAMRLNERVTRDMLRFTECDDITHSSLENTYNYTNTADKQYRYQAVFNLYYYGG